MYHLVVLKPHFLNSQLFLLKTPLFPDESKKIFMAPPLSKLAKLIRFAELGAPSLRFRMCNLFLVIYIGPFQFRKILVVILQPRHFFK